MSYDYQIIDDPYRDVPRDEAYSKALAAWFKEFYKKSILTSRTYTCRDGSTVTIVTHSPGKTKDM